MTFSQMPVAIAVLIEGLGLHWAVDAITEGTNELL